MLLLNRTQLNSGATNHIIPELEIYLCALTMLVRIAMKVGNGAALPIHHVSHSTIPTHSSPLHLHDVLHVLSITKNLLSVNQLARDSNVFFELHPNIYTYTTHSTTCILICLTHTKCLIYLIPRLAHTQHVTFWNIYFII